MFSPARPSGYPVPSQRSWWLRMIGRTGPRLFIGRQMSWPRIGWLRVISHSSPVNGPGFRRMASGIPILPMSAGIRRGTKR